MRPSEPKRWAVARLDEIPDDHPQGWWDHEAATAGFGARRHPVRRHYQPAPSPDSIAATRGAP